MNKCSIELLYHSERYRLNQLNFSNIIRTENNLVNFYCSAVENCYSTIAVNYKQPIHYDDSDDDDSDDDDSNDDSEDHDSDDDSEDDDSDDDSEDHDIDDDVVGINCFDELLLRSEFISYARDNF